MQKKTSELPIIKKITKIAQNKWVFVGAVSLFVCLFFYQYVATQGRLIEGDFDYYAQMYEAFRISVLEYGQFPSWNPWMAGGVPLYANPQFGLISIQSVLVLIFGTIYGMKLAYVAYALAGFWGMYLLGRRVTGASKLRALLVSFIWIACGFFAGHGIMHFTFALFFLLPWLFFFVFKRHEKRSWLWFGILEALMLLSSIHYAFLMTTLVMAVFFVLTLIEFTPARGKIPIRFKIEKQDILFVLKAASVILVLAGPRFIATWVFVSNNERIIDSPEIYPTLNVLFHALFLPVGYVTATPHPLQWGWWEYSMYIGIGAGLAFLVALIVGAKNLLTKSRDTLIKNKSFFIPIAIVGVLGFLTALGDFGPLSPYNILHHLPGFTQTRVPSRWLLMSMFAILIFLMAWKKNVKIINVLLLLSVIELFCMFGPVTRPGNEQLALPPVTYSDTFVQYDNNYEHLNIKNDINQSYLHATSKNIGQIYADDSLVNTLNKVYGTKRCASNTTPNCSFVLSNNAKLTYWSPNKIVLERTGPGDIHINMNPYYAWMVNEKYVYWQFTRLDPNADFIIHDPSAKITLTYSPKFSTGWLKEKLQR